MSASSHNSTAEWPLLTTKLYIPPPRPRERLVLRPRLLERLSEGLSAGHRLSLVSAPAGFGKTTLITEWVCASPREIAWVSLDPGDNDPVQFLHYLLAALQQIDGSVGQTVRQMLQAPRLPPTHGLVAPLINDIGAASSALTLVLDDYHFITSDIVHQFVQLLLERQPPSMHVVIGTRTDPPLALPRLRARGQMTEIRERDLRFTLDETLAFLNKVMDLGLATDSVRALEARTEGWVTGLQLAGLSLRGREDVSNFITEFTGSNRYILDYLVEEVLRQQSGSVQAFLLQTSILNRMTGELCNALTGGADSQGLLEALEQANLFIIPLDQHQSWYRYQRLFAEFLQSRLHQRLGRSQVADLHRRASQWYTSRGLLTEAINHALDAEDFEAAGRLIEQSAREVMSRGETGALAGWLEALPAELICSRPRLALSHAWALISSGQLDAAESRVQQALQAVLPDETDIRGEAAAIRAFIVTLRGEMGHTIALAQQALEYLSPDDAFLRGLVGLNLGLAFDAQGDLEAASRAYEQAKVIGQAVESPLISLMALTQLADIKVLQGNLHQAAEIYQHAIQLAAEPGKRLPMAGMACVGIGSLLYERNQLETATEHLLTGIELGQQWAATDILITCANLLARIKCAQGDAPGAREHMRQAGEAMQKNIVSPMTLGVAEAEQARLWLRLGDLDAAARWAAAYQAQTGASSSYVHHIQAATWARVLLAQGQPEPALHLLEPMLREAQAAGRMGNAVELLALQALAWESLGQASRALDALQRALTLAEPQGHVRTLVDEGEAMAKLLRRGTSSQYVQKLLAAFVDLPAGRQLKTAPPLNVPPLLEPLSPRELEVLQLLAAGLANKEIAQTLVIAVGTVKQHLKSIYGKLEVHNRTEAASRARTLDIL